MSEERRTIKPEDITLRLEKNRNVADVQGGEQYVDERVAEAAEKKRAEKVWEDGKSILRHVGENVLLTLEDQGKAAQAINLLGSGAGCIEIVPSTRRKALPPPLIQDVKAAGLTDVIQNEVELTLKGDLATWAIATLGVRTNDPNFELTERFVLTPAFEEIRANLRKAKQHQSLLNTLTQAGVFAAAVEAKVRRGAKE